MLSINDSIKSLSSIKITLKAQKLHSFEVKYFFQKLKYNLFEKFFNYYVFLNIVICF